MTELDQYKAHVAVLQSEITKLQAERDAEISRNRPLRNLITSLEEQKSQWNQQRNDYREAVATLDSERASNAKLTAERDALDDAACDLVPTAVECIKKLKTENESLRFEVIQIRKSLINWRQRAWPGTDQTKVVDRDFPAIAAMAQGEK